MSNLISYDFALILKAIYKSSFETSRNKVFLSEPYWAVRRDGQGIEKEEVPTLFLITPLFEPQQVKNKASHASSSTASELCGLIHVILLATVQKGIAHAVFMDLVSTSLQCWDFLIISPSSVRQI